MPSTMPVSSTATPRRVRAICCFKSFPETTPAPYTGFRAGCNRHGYVRDGGSPGRGALGHPGVRIDGLALEADLEVQARARLSAGISDLRDRLAGLDPVAGFFEQRFVVTVEAHVAATVVHDDEQSQARQPVCERYAAAMNRAHGRSRDRFEQHAVPLDGPGAAGLAEVAGEPTRHGPGELALRLRERLVAVDGKAGHELAQAPHEVGEPLLLGAQLRDGRSAVADLLVELRDNHATLVSRLLERRDFARLRRFEHCELRLDARSLGVELRELLKLAGDGPDARRARSVVVVEIDQHAAERGRALLRQQQLGQLLAPGDVARAHLPRERVLLRRERTVGALGLAREIAPHRYFRLQVPAHFGQLARGRRNLDFGGAQSARACVAPRRLARDLLLQLFDLFADRGKLGL